MILFLKNVHTLEEMSHPLTVTNVCNPKLLRNISPCAIFRSGCKGTGKINRVRNSLAPMKEHNHSVDVYESDISELKNKCKAMAKQMETTRLREVFDDVTRHDLYAREVSLAECESSMYRARRETQPKVPLTASDFVDMLSTTSLGVNFKFSVSSGDQIGVVFFSMK